MYTALRRLFVLSALTGGGYAAWSWWQRQNADEPGAAPEWPPLSKTSDAATASTNGSRAAPEAVDARWVVPVDGGCPDGYPVKANDNSGIYHVPGGRFYERTVPERCYARAQDAEADGYRAAKA